MKVRGRALILFFFVALSAEVLMAQPGHEEPPIEIPINFAMLYLILAAFGLGIKKLVNYRKKN